MAIPSTIPAIAFDEGRPAPGEPSDSTSLLPYAYYSHANINSGGKYRIGVDEIIRNDGGEFFKQGGTAGNRKRFHPGFATLKNRLRPHQSKSSIFCAQVKQPEQFVPN